MSDYLSLTQVCACCASAVCRYVCQQPSFPRLTGPVSSYTVILEPLLWCLPRIVSNPKMNLLCERVHVYFLVIRLLWLFNWVARNIRLMSSPGWWNILWILAFSTFTSVPNGCLLGIFIHTFGQKLGWENVCMDADKSIIHVRQAAWPLVLGGSH